MSRNPMKDLRPFETNSSPYTFTPSIIRCPTLKTPVGIDGLSGTISGSNCGIRPS
ncbi:uncharacterized protein EI90DRAFT_3027134 [Cantharellus anzutake]|uniref:uncharacterized protein n=1 Tax=Cantharellus anzutake TaxID=1750568 RepID=UPI0019040B43|nr:uncharacterized protein EI90DRAFT_3027134 [Cantharellus anzutake]KAF8343793.1 hypothetical protein EI90DRAFT_3027134 [Cantharellus anzutake]